MILLKKKKRAHEYDIDKVLATIIGGGPAALSAYKYFVGKKLITIKTPDTWE